MKNIFNLKKGEGISGIILILICIVLVIVIVPAFRKFQNDNAANTSAIQSSNKSIVNKGLAVSQGAASYNGNTAAW